jgi:hypothetical protein
MMNEKETEKLQRFRGDSRDLTARSVYRGYSEQPDAKSVHPVILTPAEESARLRDDVA